MHNIYSIGLAPEWLILDDVQINDGMRSMWAMFEQLEPEMSFLISDKFPHIRNSETGFGIINIKGTNNLLSRVAEIFSLLDLPSSKFIGSKKSTKSFSLLDIGKKKISLKNEK